jgi:addiction module HigA family antidote
MNKIKPIHPGAHLAEFIEEYGITVYRVAKDIGVPATRIDQIVKFNRSITADTAARLGKYFGTTAQFWLNLQTNYELELIDKSRIDESKQLVA